MNTITLPLTLEQLAFAIKQLPTDDVDRLDLLLDDKLKKTVLKRSKTAYQDFKQGNTLSLNQIKQEFNV